METLVSVFEKRGYKTKIFLNVPQGFDFNPEGDDELVDTSIP